MEDHDIAQRKRDRLLVDTVRHSFLAAHSFRRLYEQYKQGSLHFNDWAKFVDDRGKSVFFNLKESAQQLFQQTSYVITEKEQIFDLTIRSIFHLAMKLREDLYTLEIFGPKYAELNKKPPESTEQQRLIKKFQQIISRAETSLHDEMDEISDLAQDSFRQFRELLSEYCGNGLLIRYFIEEEAFIKETMGAEAFDECLRTLSGKDEAEAYRIGGESYFESAFFARAAKSFSRALGKKPGSEALQCKIYLSQGLEQFFSFALPEALNAIEKCLSFAPRVPIQGKHRALIQKVCQNIQEDFPGRRKSDLHRDLIQKARSISSRVEELPPAPPDSDPI